MIGSDRGYYRAIALAQGDLKRYEKWLAWMIANCRALSVNEGIAANATAAIEITPGSAMS